MNDENKSAELAAVYASKSWRLTAPLRQSAAWLRQMHPRRLLAQLVRWAGGHPDIRRFGVRCLSHFPTLHERMRQAVNTRPVESVLTPPVVFVMPVGAAVAVEEVPQDIAVTVTPDHIVASVAPAPPQPTAAELALNAGARQVLAQMRAAHRPSR